VEAGVEKHLHPVRVEPDDEVFSVGNDWDADATGQLASYSQPCSLSQSLTSLQ
jgi:hypothetical protein